MKNGEAIEQVSYFIPGAFFCYVPKKKGEVENLCVVDQISLTNGRFTMSVKRLFQGMWCPYLTLQIRHKDDGEIIPNKEYSLVALDPVQWKQVMEHLLGLPVSAVNTRKEISLCVMYAKRIRQITQSIGHVYTNGLFPKEILPIWELLDACGDMTPILVDIAVFVQRSELEPERERLLKLFLKKFIVQQKHNMEVFRAVVENMIMLKKQERLQNRLLKHPAKAPAEKKPGTVHVSVQG